MISKPRKCDKKSLKGCKTYVSIRKIAEKNLRKVYEKYTLGKNKPAILQICGPISTGGAGNVKDNLALFEKAVRKINKLGYYVFNQIPYEDAMGCVKKAKEKIRKKSGGKKAYDNHLLEDFYRPIMESGMIAVVVFLPGWQSSTGAKWEYDVAKKQKLVRLELRKDWLQKINDGESDIHKLTKPI